MRKLIVVFFFLLFGLIFLTFSGRNVVAFQSRATSTLIPPTATPLGTEVPTFIPSAPQKGQIVQIGKTVSGELFIGRWDIWEFEIVEPQHVTIRLRSSQFDAYLELYGPNDRRTPLYSDDDGGRGRNAMLYDVLLTETGMYHIFARSYEDEGEGPYRLSVEPNTGLVPSTESSVPIRYDELITAELEDEEDRYYFEGKAGEEVAILLSSLDFDTYLEILSSTGEILADNDDNGRTNIKDSAVTEFALPSDGLYFIVVASYILDAQGEYILELLLTNPNIENTSSQIQIGKSVTERLLPNAVREWHFSGEVGQVISVAAMPVDMDEPFDLILELIMPNGQHQIDDDGGYGRSPALTDFRLPESGDYTVQIREYNATIGGYYHLVVAEGRRYFSPLGELAFYVQLEADSLMMGYDTLDEAERYADLWIVRVPAGQFVSLSVMTGNGGEGLPQDFLIYVMDTAWELVMEPTATQIDLDSVHTVSEYLVLVRYRGPGSQTYQLQFQTSTTPPTASVDVPVLGIIELDAEIVRTLPIGQRHAWQFTAPDSAIYSITMTKQNADETLDPYLIVLNAQGEQLAQDDDSAGGFNPRITLDLQIGEQITILATGFGDQSGGDYALVVTQE